MKLITNRVGEENYNTQNLKMQIKECRTSTDIDVLFEDGVVIKNKQYFNFRLCFK